MYCNKCGTTLKDGSRFCSKCGAQIQPPTNQPPGPMPQYESSSGNRGAFFLLIGIILNIVGIIMIVYGNYKANDWLSQLESVLTTGYYNNGTAIIAGGVVLLIIGIVIDFVGILMRRR